ncbi:exo-beta-N-acetylmuramidase NamZ family protein [Pseudothermotoga thermarum]|uniref:Uncharacterized conserved protein UCP016719 n=1 Tax=Pseudothermotoga thermarum DSM 5069 TaxID=688269 RepID=F7YX49_9THEM|nr:DUF1343 domain-containing protein [Pseudothermotoga thermarum]AEH50876.1 Uncharacterized conserved protein UCP016719 [Pseudothermotoga thermarum DSM 5069]
MKLGLDVFLEKYAKNYKQARLGLVTNATGINSDLRQNIDLLVEKGLKLVKLFSPEHGIFGAAADGEKLSHSKHPKYGVPIYSLYGETVRPNDEMLEGIDVLIYDIQDVGLRFYTYIYTMAYCLEECGKRNIEFVVLDRPNPLSSKIEGPIIEKNFESFVGGYGLPIRYGLTIGELAKYINNTFKINANLTVIAMEGYDPTRFYDELGLLWNTPSPNLPSMEHTILYEGFCLLEGVNVSVGRGTVHPFKYIGAPWIDSEKLYKSMKKLSHDGVIFRERVFIPFASKFQGQVCYGLEFFVLDKRKIKPLEIAIDLIAELRELHTKDFTWDSYVHLETERFYFDRLIGSDFYRKAIEQGARSSDFVEIWEKQSAEFTKQVQPFRIY